MLRDTLLGKKARRYARSVMTSAAAPVHNPGRRTECLIEAAYFNGHRAGEALEHELFLDSAVTHRTAKR